MLDLGVGDPSSLAHRQLLSRGSCRCCREELLGSPVHPFTGEVNCRCWGRLIVAIQPSLRLLRDSGREGGLRWGGAGGCRGSSASGCDSEGTSTTARRA